MKKICFFFFLLFSLQSFSQKVVLKNNLVYDALLTHNLSVEFSLGKKWTLDTQIGMNFFFYENDATANGYKTKKWSHWLVQPEIRYWTCEIFNGWFLGLHAHGGHMLNWEDYWYWYVENRTDNRYVSVYKSGDLINWTFCCHALTADSPTAEHRVRTDRKLRSESGGKINVERPKVLYN